MMLPLWEDALPNVPDEELAAAAQRGRGRDVTAAAALARRLGTGDAVVIGLGSMVGAGVFSAFAPAARGGRHGAARSGSRSRRSWPTATPSPPRSSRRSIRPRAARTSTGASDSASGGASSPGWGFVVGKTASCAAMALTFASYAVPGSTWVQRLVGVAAVVAAHRRELPRRHTHGRADAGARRGLAARTARGRRGDRGRRSSRLEPGRLPRQARTGCCSPPGSCSSRSPATRGSRRWARRSATRSARSRARSRSRSASRSRSTSSWASRACSRPDPRRSLRAPRRSRPPSQAAGAAWALPVVRVGAAVASLGALLALIAGIGRTSLAMARNGDLPRKLAAVEPRHRVPARAELAVGAVVSRARADDRPARRDRLLVVRGADVLRNCEHCGVHADGRAQALAASAQRRGRTRVHRSRRHLATFRCRRGSRRLRRRRRRSPRVRAERSRLAQRRPSLIRGSTAPVRPPMQGVRVRPHRSHFCGICRLLRRDAVRGRPSAADRERRRRAATPTPGHGVLTGSIAQTDQTWVCRGPVDLDSVSVTMTSAFASRRGADAVHLEPGCTGHIGRLDVVTSVADGVKVAEGVHDLAVGCGTIRCHGKVADVHQDGMQVMGGSRITFRDLRIDCGRREDQADQLEPVHQALGPLGRTRRPT